MSSIIGVSVRGKTYYFHNTFSSEQLLAIKQLANSYRESNPTLYNQEDHTIITQFIHDAEKLLNCNINILDIQEILIIK